MNVTMLIVSTKWLVKCCACLVFLDMLFHGVLKHCFNVTQEFLENLYDDDAWLACVSWCFIHAKVWRSLMHMLKKPLVKFVFICCPT